MVTLVVCEVSSENPQLLSKMKMSKLKKVIIERRLVSYLVRKLLKE